MYAWLVLLRKSVEDSSHTISQHAFQRMGERGITIDDIRRCASEGDFLRAQDHGGDLKVVLRGHDENRQPFLMVAALCWPTPTIVTVMREDEG